MENFIINESGYKIIFLYNESLLNIFIKERKNKIKFAPIKVPFQEYFKKYISNFEDLINQINQKRIFIEIKEPSNSRNINYLILNIKNINNQNLLSIEINVLNIEYYLVNPTNYQRLNTNPFISYIKKDLINIDDVLEIIDNEKILNQYNIINFKYFDKQKGAFQIINKEKISIGNKIILEYFITEKKDLFINNLIWTKKYIEKEIIKLIKKVNIFDDITRKYDLIFLYASPIIVDDNYNESESPISYMEEIRIIIDLMKKKNKQFNCKFECINEIALKKIIAKNKTKILHISAHGKYDDKNKYNLVVENLQKNGKNQLIDINSLDLLLNSGKINIRQFDLIILSTCYSENFAKKFLEYGAKNVIYIHGLTEVYDQIIILFVKYFYENLIEGDTIEKSFIKAKESMKINPQVIYLNKNSCCCIHYHKKECKLKLDEQKFHDRIHIKKGEKCNCKYELYNQHDKNCEYYNLLIEKLSDTKKIKEENNKRIICCCDKEDIIEHNELEKIIYSNNNSDNGNISPFKFNKKGKLYINSTIKFNFDKDKYIFIKGRKNVMGRIFNNIINNGKYSFFLGDKELLKCELAESLCVYLIERKIINDYEMFKINSNFDFIYMNNKIDEFNYKNSKNNLKNIMIIKFEIDHSKEEDIKITIKYLTKIYTKYCNNNKLYFIFIFDSEKDKIEKFIQKVMPIKIDKNLFYPEINKDFSIELLNLFIEGKNIKINSKEKLDLVINDAKCKPGMIKLISESLLKGYTIGNIKNIIKQSAIKNKKQLELIKNNLSFPLYYLLLNMPSGLPDCFLQLIFKNYLDIYDDKHIIIKSLNNNWNIINKNNYFENNFKEIKCMEKCFEFVYKTLKLYVKLLIFFIEENKEKINYKEGNIHYIFNSYNNREIWKSKIPNTIWNLIGKKIYNKDFNLDTHKENILNLINFVINKIEIFRKLETWNDIYIEEILLLFPSFFFLKKDNKNILEICIDLVNKLIDIDKTKERNIKQNEILLKQKLLLFLYSIDETKNNILRGQEITNPELNNEINFLEEIRKNKGKNEKLEILLKKPNVSNEMKLYLLREIAINYFVKRNYFSSLENLTNILNLENLNYIIINRILIDSCYSFRQKYFKEENKIISNDKYKSIKERIRTLNNIMKNPYQKDIYNEAFYLKNKIYDLLEPDIIMLNSNPLKKISNINCNLNNQYYIINELKKNIYSHIRIKSLILNEENLTQVLNKKGEILIIQSDDYTKDGEIVCETDEGEGLIISKKKLGKIIRNNKIDYNLVILCFPKSIKLKEYLEENKISYNNLIAFNYFNESNITNDILKEYNKISIEFIISFIKRINDNRNNINIKNIIEATINQFHKHIIKIEKELKINNYIILSNYEKKDFNIRYADKIEENEIFLYGKFISFNNVDTNNYPQNYSSQVYDLIKLLKYENKAIYYIQKSENNIYLNICIEAIKFYYRHKTYKEMFCIDRSKYDNHLIKSIIRKFNKIKEENNEESEEDEEEDNFENIKQKNCLILIYNCYWADLLDVELYSLINCNCSFIVIYYDIKNYSNKRKIKDLGKIDIYELLVQKIREEKNTIEFSERSEKPGNKEIQYIKKLNIIFETTTGKRTSFLFTPGTTVDQVLTLYLTEMNQFTKVSANEIVFTHNGKKLNFGDQTKIEKLLGSSNNLVINVNELNINNQKELTQILSRQDKNTYITYIAFPNNIRDNINPLNYSISIKFIKSSKNSIYNCNKELKGILKLCFLNEIASKINDQFLDNLLNMKKIQEIIYYIMKILKNSYVDFNNRNEAVNFVEKIIGKEKSNKIINFSNFVEEQINQILLKQLMNYVPKNYINEINDIAFRLGKYENYMAFFEKELKKSLKNSVFEFSPVSLVVIDREDFDKFEQKKAKCPNLILQILYYGAQQDPKSCILTEMFKRSEVSDYPHGKGVYFTDSLDYCYIYENSINNGHNIDKIPAVGDIFNAICNLVYYDKNGFLKVKDYTTRIKPGKNQINFALVDSSSKAIDNPDTRRFVGTKYIIYEYEQICPLISIRFKREEFCVIWRDNTFSKKENFNNEMDQKFKKFLNERIRYIEQISKYNVYTFEDTNEALKCVNRKKYNKLILLSNVGIDFEGKKFVDAARQIIKSDAIVLFITYNIEHLKWIKAYKNALFSNDPNFYEEYLDSFNDINKMKELIVKLENYYNVKFNFDNNFLSFPLYKNEGYYSDLSF